MLAAELAALAKAEETPSVAVLCRTNAQVTEISRSLKDAGVQVERRKNASKGNGLECASEVLSYLRLAAHPADDQSMLAALRVPPRTGCAAPARTVHASSCLDAYSALTGPCTVCGAGLLLRRAGIAPQVKSSQELNSRPLDLT